MDSTWMKTLAGATLAVSLLAAAPIIAAEFDDWDANADGILDSGEFESGFGEIGAYDSWDADNDGVLSEDEFNEGVFSAYDEDDNDTLEEREYGDLGDDLGDQGFWDV